VSRDHLLSAGHRGRQSKQIRGPQPICSYGYL